VDLISCQGKNTFNAQQHRLPKGFVSFLLKIEIGMYLALTGSRLKGKQNLYAGVATHFCPKEKLPLLREKIIDNQDITKIIEEINQEDSNVHGIELLNSNNLTSLTFTKMNLFQLTKSNPVTFYSFLLVSFFKEFFE
jgi:enoyl-CoA hydratase/carnithine racemase